MPNIHFLVFSFYAEEKTLAASKSLNKHSGVGGLTNPGGGPGAGGGGGKFYGRDLRDYDDKDIDGLLTNLSTEELEDLNNDFDPDVSKQNKK